MIDEDTGLVVDRSELLICFPAFANTERHDSAQDTLAALTSILQFTDATRLLRFYSPLPPDKTLLIDTLHAHAALSEPFHLRLQLLSTHAAIEERVVRSCNHGRVELQDLIII